MDAITADKPAPIPHNRPTLGRDEERAARRVVRSGWLAQGAEVQAFEDEFAACLGLPAGHAVAVASGTAALYLALWALGAAGKQVAIPGYCCSSLRHAVRMAGGCETVVDSQPGQPAIDPRLVAATGAPLAIVAHMYGLPADLAAVPASVAVIEDCAQALGARLRGQPVGLAGKIGVFSFYATKLITSGGQGGMAVSTDRALVDAIRDFREFDCRRDSRSRFNFQLTDLQAAIGRSQLQKLPAFLARREEIFQAYKAAGLDLLEPAAGQAARYRAVVRTDRPQELIARLDAAGVKSIIPLEDWELLADPARLPHACALTRTTVSLPIYPSLSPRAVRLICREVAAP